MEVQDQKLKTLVTSRQSKLETDKTNFADRMQEVADYVSPHRDDIRGNLAKGEKKGSKIYDGTAVNAAVNATSGIHGYHVSPAFAWFKYQVNVQEANQLPAVRDWLDRTEFRMYMTLLRSNFYDETWKFIYDGITLGTAAMYAMDDIARERVVFEAVHPGEIYIAENQYGEVDVLHRKRRLSAKQMVEMFGEADCPEAVKNAYKASPFQEFEVIHAVFPRQEYDDRKLDKKSKRVAEVYLMTAGNHILREGGFDEFPYQVWRYLKTGKDPYGLSPATLAMPDIKGLNLMAKTLLGAAQLAVDPAYNVPGYLLGKTQLKPRGLNYMENPSDRITPVNTGDKFPIGLDREKAKQEQIKERFHLDVFLLLSQMSGGQRTAYEVSELMAEKAAVLGAELGSFNTALDGILDDVYRIETQRSRSLMPPPPQELFEAYGQENGVIRFDPIYMGPLAQAQRERFAKDGIRKFMAELQGLVNLQMAAQQAAEVLDNFDLDEASRILADSNRVPAKMIRAQQQIDAVRQGRVAAMQQQNQQAQAMEAVQGLKTVSEADKNTGGKISATLSDVLSGGGINAAA